LIGSSTREAPSEVKREAVRKGSLPLFFSGALLTGLLVSVAASCTPAVHKPPAASAESLRIPVESYFPLTDKSQWNYRVQDLVRNLTYQTKVRVYGRQYVDAVRREGIAVEERYSNFGLGGPFVFEEQEPIVYFRENGYLNRVLLTYQAGKVVAASGSADRQYLPEVLTDGASWDSNTEAFHVGDLGFKVSFRHAVAVERETVKVPAGSFGDCIRVDTSSTEGPDSGYRPGEELVFYYSDWYAPGVGLVLTRQWDDAARLRERTRIELLSYSITPAGHPTKDRPTIDD
jgi:hypothetical protein